MAWVKNPKNRNNLYIYSTLSGRNEKEQIYPDDNYGEVITGECEWKIEDASVHLNGRTYAQTSGVTKEVCDHMAVFVISPHDAVKQYNMCINTWSLRHLTSAEEYPDEEYLDMSKSSSLQDTTSVVRH